MVENIKQDAIDKFEPEAMMLDRDVMAIVSLAISVKRIADVLEGNPNRLGIVDGVMFAVEQGLINASLRRG